MLIGIDPILSPELLLTLSTMGHGDDLVICDANFPAASHAQHLIRLDGLSATQVLKAVLTVFPLDTYVNDPAQTMAVVDKPQEVPPIVEEFQTIINDHADHSALISPVERFAFYENAKKAYAIIQTSELRLYGNILLKKGVINPAEKNK